MTEISEPPEQSSKSGSVGRLLIGIVLILVFYVVSVPWVFHLTNLSLKHPSGKRISAIYCKPVRGLMKRNSSFRSVYVPYWQWTFRVVHWHLK